MVRRGSARSSGESWYIHTGICKRRECLSKQGYETDSGCKAMEFVDSVVGDTQWTHDLEGPEMTKITEVRIERSYLKGLVAASAFESDG